MQIGWTNYITSVQPNVIGDADGKEHTSYQHKVHISPSGPHIITPEVPIPPQRVNTAQPPRVDKGGNSSNFRSRGNKNHWTWYALTAQCQKTREEIQLPIRFLEWPRNTGTSSKAHIGNLGNILCKQVGTVRSRYQRGQGEKYGHVHSQI